MSDPFHTFEPTPPDGSGGTAAYRIKHRNVEERFFDDPERVLVVEHGEHLLRQDETNTRLYLVRNGDFSCVGPDEGGQVRELFVAHRGNLLGITSFFGRPHISPYTVTAMGRCEVAYIDRADVPANEKADLDANLLPLVVHALHQRYLHGSNMERMLSIAQFAAGVAHELNNALAVLGESWGWIDDQLQADVARPDTALGQAFIEGRQGKRYAGREARQRGEELRKRHKIDRTLARHWGRSELPEELLTSSEPPQRVLRWWELGSTMSDCRAAAEHAKHILTELRQLANRKPAEREEQHLIDTLEDALSIIRTATIGVEVHITGIAELPPIAINKGQFVQLWTNLIRNACNALCNGKTPDPRIEIDGSLRDDALLIVIADNGPGIPRSLLPHLFEPRVSSQEGRISLGLGLGLAVVKTIVNDHGGVIRAFNTSTGARFVIRIPQGGPAWTNP